MRRRRSAETDADDARRTRQRGTAAGVRVRPDRRQPSRPTEAAVSIPGPTLVLRRGEPVEITLVNRLSEGTAIHWHGMELDSYYDGVHGFSGAGARVTPLIAPGGTFVVRFTPPRTGTFIYHTHLHDNRQLPSGLYGALLVVDPGASGDAYDPATDHVFVIGGGNFVIGGVSSPAPFRRCSTASASRSSSGRRGHATACDSSTSRPTTSSL